MLPQWCTAKDKMLTFFFRLSWCELNYFKRFRRICNMTCILTFILGVTFAFLVSILSGYVRNTPEFINNEFSSESHFVKDNKKIFSILPYEYCLTPEDDVELSIRKSDIELSSASSTVEALGSLYAAIEMKTIGKIKKAQRLFQHAVALAPKHPDVLNHYGEFLEETQHNIILADQMYFQALTHSPGHMGAMSNRARVARTVEELDRDTLRRIDEKRDTVSKIPDSNPALRRAKKEAYFQHIYHTCGIEGNTMSLSQTRSIVETRMAVGGKSIAEHNEILGLDAALKYINNTLINRLGEITVNDILEIHRRVLGFADPLESGLFRRTQVFVGGHIPPGPNSIPPLMQEFAMWLNSESAQRLHPVRYSALAHYKLVHIHPFSDGNGRTSRLLMNMILMQAGFPPVIILKQERHRYYQMLELANEGDVRPFVRFIGESTEQTLDLFLWATSEFASDFPALGPAPPSILKPISKEEG